MAAKTKGVILGLLLAGFTAAFLQAQQDYAFSRIMAMQYLDLIEGTVPPTPEAGLQRWFGNSATHTAACLLSDGSACTASGGGGSIPAGLIALSLSAPCPAGFAEVAALDGRTIIGTLEAHADVQDTGGADAVTPTVASLSAAAQTFTGTPFSSVINHTHPVVDPGHTHGQNAPTSASSGAVRFATDTNASGSTASLATSSSTTGVTTSNPAGGVASITPAGTNSASAVTGTLNQFDNRPAFVKVLFCEKT